MTEVEAAAKALPESGVISGDGDHSLCNIMPSAQKLSAAAAVVAGLIDTKATERPTTPETSHTVKAQERLAPNTANNDINNESESVEPSGKADRLKTARTVEEEEVLVGEAATSESETEASGKATDKTENIVVNKAKSIPEIELTTNGEKSAANGTEKAKIDCTPTIVKVATNNGIADTLINDQIAATSLSPTEPNEIYVKAVPEITGKIKVVVEAMEIDDHDHINDADNNDGDEDVDEEDDDDDDDGDDEDDDEDGKDSASVSTVKSVISEKAPVAADVKGDEHGAQATPNSHDKSNNNIENNAKAQKENGIACRAEKVSNDSVNVVVLGDDSDIELSVVPTKDKIQTEKLETMEVVKEKNTDTAIETGKKFVETKLEGKTEDAVIEADTVVTVLATPLTKNTNEKDSKSMLSNSICSDSDGAVIINSDSETETAPITEKSSHNDGVDETQLNAVVLPTVTTPPTQLIDDDDDDCVVIEDDIPTSTPLPNDLNKRKSNVLDNQSNPYDANNQQPPSKRQRQLSSQPQQPLTIGQLTIKDARTLMPPDAASVKRSSLDTSIYPVNITPAASANIVPTTMTVAASTLTTAGNVISGNGNQGLPKLVPMSPTVAATTAATAAAVVAAAAAVNAAAASVMPLMSGLPGLSTNANLLPGLTDDMFVLEAPSFIVPYIYEKPPVDNLRDVIKELEVKYKLSKEDLADAIRSDEFDMMTEQNRDEKCEEKLTTAALANITDKKKKRRRGADDPDESWSEESDEDDDEDDDDDDSDVGVRTKVLIKEASDDLTALKGAIKPAAAVSQSGVNNVVASVNSPTVSLSVVGAITDPSQLVKPGQENYFESPLGKFFMDIGVGLVQEFVQSDLIRLQKRKMRKSLGKNISEFERAITALSGNLEASRKKNAPFKFTLKRCEFCIFKSESALAMANHYETPHMNGQLYKCNFCSFEIRNATEIVYHMEAVHNIKARLIKPLPYHQCPNCGFEDNGKAKLARHQPVCAKKFRPELNLAPPSDWEAPAKIPRIKPRHGLVGTATAYQVSL